MQRRQWHPTPVLLPGKSHGWRSLVGCSPWGHKESDMTEHFHFHFSLSCIGEGNGNPLQCSCLENPRDGGAWWAAIYGVAQSWTWLNDLAAAIINDLNPNWCFWIVVLEKTLESPLDDKEIKPVKPKENQPWTFIGRTDAEAEAPILWPLEKILISGKDWRQKKRVAEDEMVGSTLTVDMNLSKLWEIVKDRETSPAVVHGVAKNRPQLSNWTTTTAT